jgi:competence protein ComEA
VKTPPSPATVRLCALALVTGLAALGWSGARRGAAGAPAPAAAAAPGAPAAAALVFGARLDLNRASAADLEALPGIGRERAERIVAERAARGGRFDAVDDLRDVPGIGPKTLARLRRALSIDGDAGDQHEAQLH